MTVYAISKKPPLLLVLLGLPACCTGGPIDKDSLLAKYRDRFVVVMDGGMSIGIGDADKARTSGSSVELSDAINRAIGEPPCLSIIIKGPGEVKARTTIMSKC